MIKFEIIIITYNQETTIGGALNSAINQTLLPYKISVYDDNSFDSTLSIVQSIAEKNIANIEIYHNEKNLGIFGNVNKAIDNSSGDIICFLAGDDEFELDLIENLHSYIEKKRIDISLPFWIIPDIKLIYSDGTIENVYHSKYKKVSAFELILSGKLRSFEIGLSHAAAKWSRIRTDCGYQADNLKSLLLAKKAKIYLADFFGYKYRVDVGVTYNSKKVDLLISRRTILNILLQEQADILSKRELVLVRYELAKTNLNIGYSIISYAKLLLCSIRIVFMSSKVYSLKNIISPLVSTRVKSTMKKMIV